MFIYSKTFSLTLGHLAYVDFLLNCGYILVILRAINFKARHILPPTFTVEWYFQALGKHLYKSHRPNSFGTLSPSLPQSNKHCGYFFLPQAWQTFGSSKSQEMTIQKLAANHPGKHTPTHPPTPQKTHKVQTDGVTFTKNLR